MSNHKPTIKLTDRQRSLVEDNWRLVLFAVRKYGGMCCWRINREDMKREFSLAICDAARTYDKSKGKFSGWAFWWFYKSFMDLLRDKHRRGLVGAKVIEATYERNVAFDSIFDEVQLYRDRERRSTQARDIEEMREEYRFIRGSLTKRQREILDYRCEGMSFKEIGVILGMTKQAVSYIEQEAVRRLQRELAARSN